MTRPITLFTGQWADLPFEEVARLAGVRQFALAMLRGFNAITPTAAAFSTTETE
jgi:hypothetical protein